MDWLIAATAAGVLFGVNSIVAKHLLDTTTDFAYSYIYSILATVFYTPFFIYFILENGITLSPLLLGAVTVSGIGNIAGFLVYNSSIKGGPLSEIIPLTKLTPIFTAITGAVFLSETLNMLNIAGIGMVTVGSYVVLRHHREPLLEPVQKLIRSRPHQLAALSAVIWSFVAIVDRFSTQRMAPEVYTYLMYVVMVLGYTLHLSTRKQKIGDVKKAFKSDRKLYALTGLMAAAASLAIFTAFSLAPASKVIPVLQIQVLISVVAGLVLFNEKGLFQKLVGSVVLIAGVILVSM
jgi:uncharacterized membrane protein